MTVYRVTWQARNGPKDQPTTLTADYPSEAEAFARAELLVSEARAFPQHVLVLSLDVVPDVAP